MDPGDESSEQDLDAVPSLASPSRPLVFRALPATPRLAGALWVAALPLPEPLLPAGALQIDLLHPPGPLAGPPPGPLTLRLEPIVGAALERPLTPSSERRRSLSLEGLPRLERLALTWPRDTAPPAGWRATVACGLPPGRLTGQPIRLPDFLGLGVQRSGSTWLYHVLGASPGIALGPVKELHFFERYYGRRWTSRLEDSEAFQRRRERGTAPAAGAATRTWWAAYDALPREARDWLWYAELFGALPEAAAVGEITPQYALLPAACVGEIADRLPDLKAFVTLRDPLARAWSQLFLFVRQHEIDPATLTPEAMLAILRRPSVLTHGNYRRLLRTTWGALLPPERLRVQFYDDLPADPQAYRDALLGFLLPGAPPPRDAPPPAERPRLGLRPPDAVRDCLAAHYASQLAWLRQHFGAKIAGWGRPWD